jgi:hypothetical protein
VGEFTRLKGLGYEPSYLALMLAPVFLFQLSRLINGMHSKGEIALFFFLLLGLIFSFSFGVLGCLMISLAFTYLYFLHSKNFVQQTRKPVLLVIASGISLFSVLFLLKPDAALFLRMRDLLEGKDLSANSRLYDSFVLSFRILGERIWFGLGPGQLKQDGFYLIKSFYQYSWVDSWAPAMPNSISDWLCNFGLAGVLAKLGFELFLFFSRRVYQDFFRLSCFIFIFIYQFTGGYLFCLPELILWSFSFALPVNGHLEKE